MKGARVLIHAPQQGAGRGSPADTTTPRASAQPTALGGVTMLFARALFALIGIILLAAAAFVRPQQVSLALLGAACLALSFELPLLHAGL